MRKTVILAVIACILGIVILAGLAFYIPEKLGNQGRQEESEMFTGFNLSTEESKHSDSSISDTDHPASAASETSPSLSEQKSGQTSSSDDNASSLQADQTENRPGQATPKKAAQETTEEESGERSGSAASDGTDFDSSDSDSTGSVHADFDSSDSDSTGSVHADSGSTGFDSTSSGASGKTETVKKHRIIWVGDSRTLGLRDALHKAEREDDDLFVGKVGEGVHWFQEEGMSELSDVIEENPGLPVVMNFGVNDPQLVSEYVVAYWDVIEDHPDTSFYILSVNPLDEEFLIEDGLVDEAVFEDINSLNVAKMNVKLKEEFKSRYIDSASYLKSDGFDTVDGLHFSTQTYLKIHDFVVKELF